MLNEDNWLTPVSITMGHFDQNLLDDVRIPRQLLTIEDKYVPWNVDECLYQCPKYDADEKCRRILTEWMLDVCIVSCLTSVSLYFPDLICPLSLVSGLH